tara:strand:+ start:404 stop:613 length:210 start_codon:yes stop_codon:yes gene_type:complete
MQISLDQVAVGDIVTAHNMNYQKGRKFSGTVKVVRDDSVTIRVSRNGRGIRNIKIYNEDIVKVSRYGAA